MKIVLVCLLAVAFAEDPLRSVLRSPSATASLYKQAKSENHLEYTKMEDNMRFRLFRSSAAKVADYNEDPEDSGHYGINMFSFMTPSEKKSYLGLNITGVPKGPEDDGLKAFTGPSKVLWTDSGDVTPVKNQGSCGSCWTFGAVGGLETHYKQKSGVLRNFAEQEYLDCVYSRRDGCNGGWMSDCFDWSAKNGGRAAATKDMPYNGKDGSCKASSTRNAAIAFKITGNTPVGRSESANLAALVKGSLSVAFEVTDKFFQYDGKKLMRDNTCRGSANHAVTMVGYTSSFILVKNSWGTNWGDQGFVKFARNYHNCHLYDYSSYPALTSTGQSDSGSDQATDYKADGSGPDPGPNPNPDPDCKDVNSDCDKWKSYCKSNGWVDYMKKNCAKTCNYCEGGDGGDCPSGTVRCPDGVCRHEHMC